MARTYENKNAAAVLAQVQAHIAELEAVTDWRMARATNGRIKERGYSGKHFEFVISEVCEELSIFDWWNDTLSKSQLKEMKKFLETAIKMGYTGYVCFKVGTAGCAHGMWASKNESTDGYSPKGATLFRGFRSDSYNDWDACLEDGDTWLHDIVTDVDSFSLKDVKTMLKGVEA